MHKSQSLKDQRTAQIESLMSHIAAHFGETSSLWKLDQTTPVSLGGDGDRVSDAVHGFATEDARRQPRFTVTPLNDLEDCLIAGWPTADGYWIAATTMESRNRHVYERLAKSWLDLQSVKEELSGRSNVLNRLTAELSRGYEELAVTRHFASKQVELDVSHNIEVLAAQTLPDLLRSIRADAIALVRHNDGSSNPNVIASRFGKAAISDSHFLECVHRFGAASFDFPFVRNQAIENLASIRGLAIVCIRKGSDVFGWLVAVNPTHRISGADGTALSEQELGSFETTLMESAASFFSSHVQNSELVRQLESQFTSVVRALVSAIEAKDPYTRGHSERVAQFARIVARRLGLSDSLQAEIHFTGLLHDIGKIGIPDAILRKDGRLTDEEFDVVKTHPTIGWEIVRDVEELAYAKHGILHHHETYDGTGYPHQLAGDDIPLFGRIIAVADAFDAMTSDRSYRKGMSVEEVSRILTDGAGSQWDPEMVAAFLSVLPEIQAVAKLD